MLEKLYKNWWVHNLIAHPLMQIVQLISTDWATRIHDVTLPPHKYTGIVL